MIILQQARGLLSSNDQLSLDLPFADTKSLTARVGPTPTFTRASSATYFGPLVDFGAFLLYTTGIANDRAYWEYIGIDQYSFEYTGTNWQLRVQLADAEHPYYIDAAAGIEWRPDQANWSGSGVTATTSSTFGIVRAANNEPRFYHNPITLACKGLLIEEQRTNSITDSNAFNTWTMTNATVAGSSVLTPEGRADAWKLVEDILLANHTSARNFSAVSGTTYTASVWLKSAENGFAFVGLSGGGFASTFISVNLSTGAVSTALGTPIGATSEAHSNGWWRISFSVTATASLSSTISIRLSRDGNWANRSYLGNGVNGMYCYGAQVEAGETATSYIPTVASSVVRSADVCSITGSDFTGFYNQAEGTLLANAFTPASGDRTVLATDDNTANEMIRLRTEGTNPFLRVIDGGSEVVAIDAGTVTANTAFKLIGAYKVNDFASSINGGSAVTDTTGTIPTVDRMRIGSGQSGNTMCGCISAIRYYKKRLPDAKLQALTV